jgi:hypothetical protein
MNSNIIAMALFFSLVSGVTIVKAFYADEFHFAFVESDLVDEIRKIEDIEHLRSITIGYIAMNDHQVKSYNSLFDNSLNVVQALSFLGFIFSVGAVFGSGKKNQHPNQAIHNDAQKDARM